MISFVCPFCAKRFTVQDALAGHHIKCSQCGADVPVPAAPPPPAHVPPPYMPAQGVPPTNVVESANRASWFALVLGLASIVACCLSAIPSVIFGVVALSKGGVDPALLKPAKTRAILGIVLAIVLSTVEFIGLAMFGQKAKEEEAKEIAAADAHYDAKRWSEAKPVYEKHTKSVREEVKAKCHARLGRIEFEQGDPAAARLEFEKAWKAKNDFEFTCDNPEVQKLWEKTVRQLKRESGKLSFETKVAGERAEDVTVTNWRLQGQTISFQVTFKTDPKKLKVELRILGDADREISDKYFYWDMDKVSRSDRLITPEFKGDWDDVRKVVLYVESR